MGALLNSLFQVIYTIGYFLLTLVWQVVRVVLNIAVLLENVNQWIIENIGLLVSLITDLLSAPLAMMFLIAISALGAWYLFNTVVATRKWVEPSQLLIYGFITLFFFAGPTVIITQLEELRGALQLNLATAITTIEDETTGEILAIDADGSDTGLPATIPDVMSLGAYENVVDPFDMAAAYLLLTTIDELDNTEFPQAFEAAYAEDDPTNASFDGFEGFTTSMAAMMDGFTVLVTSLLFILPTVAADHLLRLVLTLVAVILYLGAPLAMLLAYFVYTNSFLAAYIRQYINLLIETFLTYLIISVVIYAMQAAALASIGLFLAVGLVALIIYIWRIASALKLATRGVDLFGGGTLTGGSTGLDLARSGLVTAGIATAAAGGGALVAAAGGLRGVDRLRGDSQDPAALERDRRLKVLAGYAVGSSRPLGQAVDKVARAQGLVRTVVVPPAQQQPNGLDYLSVGNVAALNNSPFYRMGLDQGFSRAFRELGGRQRYFGGTVDPDEMGMASPERPAPAGNGRGLATHPDQGVISPYQQYRREQGAFENRFRYEQVNPDLPVTPFAPEQEEAYQAWRRERGQFQARWEKEQSTGRSGRRYAGAGKEMRYARFAAGQQAEAEREAAMLARYAWAQENPEAAPAAAYASRLDEALYQTLRARLDKFDERFGWERHHDGESFPAYVDIAEERAYQGYAAARRDAAAGGLPPEAAPPSGTGDGRDGGRNGGPGRSYDDSGDRGPAGWPGSDGPAGSSPGGWRSGSGTEAADIESPEIAETGRSRTPLTPPPNFAAEFPEAAGSPTARQPAGSPALSGEGEGEGQPAGAHAATPPDIRLNVDDNGLPIRVIQLDTNQDGQPDNWRQTTSTPGQLSLAAYDPYQVERLAPALTRLAEGPDIPPGDPVTRALQAEARADGVGAAGLIQAAEAINSQYGQLQTQGLPAGEILEAFRAGPLMEQIRAETGLPLSGATLGRLTDALLQPQRLLLPADLAAAAASAGRDGEAGMAAQLGISDSFGAMTGVVRELVAATQALGLSQAEAAAVAARVSAGQGEAVRADLVAQTRAPAAAHQFVSSVQLLRPLPVPQSVLPVPAGDLGATQTESEE